MWEWVISDELYHHGIKGQKWGERNGPPYPLGASDHSSSEKKALDKSSSKTHTNDKKESGLSDKQKKAIKIGAAVAVTALATYGTYKLAKSGKLDKFISKGKTAADSILEENNGFGDLKNTKTSVTDYFGKGPLKNEFNETINTLSHKESLQETLSNVNPNRGDPRYANNCTYCSVTAFCRRNLGLDVTARVSGGTQHLDTILKDAFKNVEVFTDPYDCFGNTKQQATEKMVKVFGNNASGVLGTGVKDRNYGHAINWEIKDGVVSFFDSQSKEGNILANSDYYFTWIDLSKEFVMARLDNCELDLDGVTTYVKNR